MNNNRKRTNATDIKNIFVVLLNRESARSTESTDLSLNKSSSRSSGSNEYHSKHNPATLSNPSAKQYLSQHNQLPAFNKSNGRINVSETNSYRLSDLEESRLVIQEDDECEKSEDIAKRDIEIGEPFNNVLVVGRDNNHLQHPAHYLIKDSKTHYGETLDLSKRKGIQHDGNLTRNCNISTPDGTAFKLTESSILVSSSLSRLSNNNTTAPSVLLTLPSTTPVSSNISSGTNSALTIVPYSQVSTIATNAISHITPSSPEALLAIRSPLSQHINPKDRTVEGRILQIISVELYMKALFG